jgi:hypothetical protein
MKRVGIIISVIVVIGAAAGLYYSSDRYQRQQAEQDKQNLPVEENVNIVTSNLNVAVNTNTLLDDNANANVNISITSVPGQKNFAVPFTSQAPNAVWDQDHEEFCEEASVLMVGRFWKQLPISDADDAERALQKIKAWELDNLGYYFDTTAAETAKVLEGLYQVKTRLMNNPTIDDIKTEIAAGRPVIVPTAGRELGNPYFTSPGPIYHMVVIKGYTADGKFITNDAGTKHGANYVYDQSVIMNAMHDWIPGSDRTKAGNGTTTNGGQVVIVAQLE